jgi:hypothetical protein
MRKIPYVAFQCSDRSNPVKYLRIKEVENLINMIDAILDLLDDAVISDQLKERVLNLYFYI